MTKGDKQMDITDAAKKRVSRAALIKACDLRAKAREDYIHSDPAVAALARHLQQTSDVANYVSTFLVENCPGALVTRRIVAKLRPLILPDEPCKHVPMRKQHGPGWHCCECGAPLQFVEATDD